MLKPVGEEDGFFLFTLRSAGADVLLRALCNYELNWIAHSKHGLSARSINMLLFILHLAFSVFWEANFSAFPAET